MRNRSKMGVLAITFGVVVLVGCAGAVAVVEPEEGEEAVLVARVDTVWADTVGR